MKFSAFSFQLLAKGAARGFLLPETQNSKLKTSSRGLTTILVVGFMGVLMLIIGAVSSYTFQQSKYGRVQYAREQALHIAEAGLEYYRWWLNKNKAQWENGGELMSPYVYTVTDPEGGTLGSATVTATPYLQCGVVQWIDLESVGTSNASVGFPRTLATRYMKPSVAEYSYIVDSSVQAGADRDIKGRYHSNGGVRMDGTNNSDVTSALATWNCTSNYGCNPAQPNAPGVVGSGPGFALWNSPVASITFDLIEVNTADLLTQVQTQGGIYYGPASGSANSRGYHLVFNSNGTVTISRVHGTSGVPSYSTQYLWQTGSSREFSIINNETNLGTFSIPPSCAVLFFQDRVWIEGVVKGKVTVVAATPNNETTRPDIYLKSNILYALNDGTDGLTAVAEADVLLPITSPNVMEIHGIFVAQDGHYGRDFFTNDSWYSSDQRVGSAYASFVSRSTLTTVGTVVSKARTGTSWGAGYGYQQRYDHFDQLLAFSPPPFTPTSSTDYKFVLWREL